MAIVIGMRGRHTGKYPSRHARGVFVQTAGLSMIALASMATVHSSG